MQPHPGDVEGVLAEGQPAAEELGEMLERPLQVGFAHVHPAGPLYRQTPPADVEVAELGDADGVVRGGLRHGCNVPRYVVTVLVPDGVESLTTPSGIRTPVRSSTSFEITEARNQVTLHTPRGCSVSYSDIARPLPGE
ncbi:MAG: hypothetical protein AB7I08_02230 [Thermoleophilia bacterium]